MLAVPQIFVYWIPCLPWCNELEALPSFPELQERNFLCLKTKKLNRKLCPAPWKMWEFLTFPILPSALSVSDEQTVCWVQHLYQHLYQYEQSCENGKPTKDYFYGGIKAPCGSVAESRSAPASPDSAVVHSPPLIFAPRPRPPPAPWSPLRWQNQALEPHLFCGMEMPYSWFMEVLKHELLSRRSEKSPKPPPESRGKGRGVLKTLMGADASVGSAQTLGKEGNLWLLHCLLWQRKDPLRIMSCFTLH